MKRKYEVDLNSQFTIQATYQVSIHVDVDDYITTLYALTHTSSMGDCDLAYMTKSLLSSAQASLEICLWMDQPYMTACCWEIIGAAEAGLGANGDAIEAYRTAIAYFERIDTDHCHELVDTCRSWINDLTAQESP